MSKKTMFVLFIAMVCTTSAMAAVTDEPTGLSSVWTAFTTLLTGTVGKLIAGGSFIYGLIQYVKTEEVKKAAAPIALGAGLGLGPTFIPNLITWGSTF